MGGNLWGNDVKKEGEYRLQQDIASNLRLFNNLKS